MKTSIAAATAALLLAGCAATDVETESRNFQVQQTSAIGSGAGQSDEAIRSLGGS